ncbi:hypothetical protein RF11_06499 [Thelohanellus kitauei]|uniref:Tc1-like transposase DDE domain-containing protein n=1 Tax=Thelohanellus kitauei TaxID=669202 RepID=A0A0C2N6E6_THEKT|nr:hypothetical protein RF11_06499 [Thelohanellus kitauei]
MIFTMDNVPFHRDGSIKRLKTADVHEVFDLPPRSPCFNRIKSMFSLFRSNLRNDLIKQIQNAKNLIKSQNLKNYFEHMENYFPHYLRKEKVRNLKPKYGRDQEVFIDNVVSDSTITLLHRRASVKPVNSPVTPLENHMASNIWETSLGLEIEAFP